MNFYKIEPYNEKYTRFTIATLANFKGSIEQSKTSKNDVFSKYVVLSHCKDMVKKFQNNVKTLKSDDGEYRKLKNMDRSIKENSAFLEQTPNLYEVLEFKKHELRSMQEQKEEQRLQQELQLQQQQPQNAQAVQQQTVEVI